MAGALFFAGGFILHALVFYFWALARAEAAWRAFFPAAIVSGAFLSPLFAGLEGRRAGDSAVREASAEQVASETKRRD